MTVWIVTGILLLTLYLLVSERMPVGLTGLGIMVLLTIAHISTPVEAVAGLANPAVITVGAMFVISRGMMRTDAVALIGRRIIQLAGGNLRLALVIFLLTVAVASAFVNNTPVVVLFIPVVMTMCCELGFSPSKFLIPISYASILSGTCTLIGTSTNIIVSDLSAQYGYGAIGMFELSRLGIPLSLAGLVLLLVTAPRWMPSLANPVCLIQNTAHRRYLAELRIPRKSNLVGREPAGVFSVRHPEMEVLELIRYSHIYHPPRDPVEIAPDDLLLVKGSLNDLVAVLHHEEVELPLSEKGLSFNTGREETVVVELIITPQSDLLGQRLLETKLMRNPDVNVIAIKRSNLHFTERQLHDVRLRVGDILLVWSYASKLEHIRAEQDHILIEAVHEEIVHRRKTWLSMAIFTGMVAAAASGWADIMICALGAAFLMIVTGCLQMRDAYRALQGDVLLLIAGTIALGAAMDKTGTSRVYAEAFLKLLSGLSPSQVLGGVILMTSVSTQVLSNNATAVLVLPIAISAAHGIGVDPKPFIIGVCFGASACFATPMGYQTNLLVYGPGGYRFSDYLKLGIPLNLLVLAAGMIFIPRLWPF